MRRNISFSFLFTLAIILFPCCGKDGEIGPQGQKGDQGEVGPAGNDGSIIYSGNGQPLSSIGVSGDYYLDSQTGLLYGPKQNDNSWEESANFSLMGANGQNGQDGEDGSEILSGDGAPPTTIGSLGDYYLDKESYVLYGPKFFNIHPASGMLSYSWGAGLELKGSANVRSFVYSLNSTDWSFKNNTSGIIIKVAYHELAFPAMTKDIYDNGVVLLYTKGTGQEWKPLPYIYISLDKNLYTHYFTLEYSYTLEEYCIVLKKRLDTINNSTELVYGSNETYCIKIITGQEAEQIFANAPNNNPEELFKAAISLGLIE